MVKCEIFTMKIVQQELFLLRLFTYSGIYQISYHFVPIGQVKLHA